MKILTPNTILVVVLTGAVAALTVLVRVPTPATSGYLNLGDIAVVFCGLFLGGRLGVFAGGVGSALADLISGAFVYVPITLIAKGLEALIAGTLGKKHPLFLALAAVAMFGSYFSAEIFLPGMGWAAAVSSLPLNIIQGTIGAIGGFLIYLAVKKALPKTKD